MATLYKQIMRCIEKKLDMGFRKFIIYPFGEVGRQTRDILRDMYGIEAEYMLDNHLCKYNPAIKPLDFLDTISCDGLCALLAATERAHCQKGRQELQRYFADEAIAELPLTDKWYTRIGKYSYGPLCRNHPYVESIGAFSSFAPGADVVGNHSFEYLTTSLFIAAGAHSAKFQEYNTFRDMPWFLEGVQPHRDKIKSNKRITIGNDVWLGQNVIITNCANIGNGVIAGAGAIITKDVPDYAVVVGVPARIIRFRYSPEEIEQLNKIAWWDWTDDEIRERYDDFYLPINKFIEKYS